MTYLALARVLGLYKDVLWQASNPGEQEEIRRWFGAAARIAVVPDVSAARPLAPAERVKETKRPGYLKVVFASRICKIKNLDQALKTLSQVGGNVEFNIYGPLEDKGYWQSCKTTIDSLPSNVTVRYRGAIDHEQVAGALSENHLFFLPTLSESYGHAIVEAMQAGCPVLISDQTPWRGLEEKRVGWDVPLTSPDLFQKALQTCIDMDQATYRLWSDSARAYAAEILRQDRGTDLTRTMFNNVVI